MKGNSKVPMVLLEITLMLLTFSICAGVCLRLFYTAHCLSREAEELTGSSMWAQSVAEVVKASGGNLDAAAQTLNARRIGEGLELWLDSSWEPGGEMIYLVSVSMSGEEGHVRVARGGEPLFELEFEVVLYG